MPHLQMTAPAGLDAHAELAEGVLRDAMRKLETGVTDPDEASVEEDLNSALAWIGYIRETVGEKLR